MQTIDTLIHAGWVVPIVPSHAVLPQHSVAIHQGCIVALLPTAQARAQYTAKTVVDLAQSVVMPGLINAHTHLAMNLLRGVADDLPLMTWLNEHIWPLEAQLMSHEFVKAGSQLAMAELILSGVTSFNDHYFFPEATAEAAIECGLRGWIGAPFINFPSSYANDMAGYFSKAEQLQQRLQDAPLLNMCLAAHAPYTVPIDDLVRLNAWSERDQLSIHIHVHETQAEIDDYTRAHGMRPLALMQQRGILSERLIAVHMTQLTESEISQVVQHKVSVAHCPESNLKLASGFCPIHRLVQAGVNVGLGTDGAASNNDLDMFGEMRIAALLAKVVAADATALSAPQALHMATLGGAKALRAAHQIGSLEVGKQADLIALDMQDITQLPHYNMLSQLVYASSRQQVSHVWVNGRCLLQNRQLTTINEHDLRAQSALWINRIQQLKA